MLITKDKRESEETGLYLNVKKTNMTITGELDSIILDDNNIEIVDKCIFLGVIMINDGVTDNNLRKILAIGKCSIGSLKGILKDRGISLKTKVMICQTFIFPIIPWHRNLYYQKGREGKLMLSNYI